MSGPQEQPPVACAGLVKSYPLPGRDPVTVLRDVSLSLPAGTMTAVTGPSGSGKSTLLSCLAGLEPASAGRAWLLGQPLWLLRHRQLARLRRDHVGFVFQSTNLVPTMTGEQNVALPFVLRRRTPPRDQVARTLDRLGVAHCRTIRPQAMSGGEQVRVALARVLLTDPTVVFADEPTGALDQRSAGTVMDLLSEVATGRGRTVVVVTHDPRVAARCDATVRVRDGRLVPADAPG
ncbi:ABC transporter ATP-binding protein [Cellulomonas triticagri]|uniref:ABC transporter ATP-binding protein n=1 Tax=Cellulomonas triticagri TaxID=2483352 RepID=A0A3M2J6G2_9CELL|nr:ABC transporter ATP-binding protein [Cellulomonas triticagri]RMI09702.1 ABC transporter ATP-binding protein [Cellulomonas triticagri]